MKTEQKTDLELFAEACRQNTGKHMLDSGGAYGRHWEKGPIDTTSPVFSIKAYGSGTGRLEEREPDITAIMETYAFLADSLEVDRELQAQFEVWAKDKEGTWFTLAQDFMGQLSDESFPDGWESRARDNVYNGEQDLSQVFIWEVYTPKDSGGEWLYAQDHVTVIHIHTGCDVRGGYGSPLFCKSKKEFAVPVDFCVQWHIEKGTDSEGNELSGGECSALCEKWTSGYTSWPTGEFQGDVQRVVSLETESITVVLKSGETVKVYPALPW